MYENSDASDDLRGLTATSHSAFPKQCTTCGRRFETVEAFIRETRAVGQGHTGLKRAIDDAGQPVIELFRNCPCGSTLMDCFNDRRDLSNEGLKRRQLFDRFFVLLQNRGMSAPAARVELLKILRGEGSHALEKLGIANEGLKPAD